MPSPRFAEEQLSHATYVHLGDGPCSEETVLEAFRDGRTCAGRDGVEFASFTPAPSFGQTYQGPALLTLDLPESYVTPRPRVAIVLRDGVPVHWVPYAIESNPVQLAWKDPSPLPGEHVYQVYVPSKFLSSPVRFRT